MYKKKLDDYAVLRPFRVNTEQLELLEPVERIQIEKVNRLRPKNKHQNSNKKSDHFYKFSLLSEIANILSNNSKLLSDKKFLKKVVIIWMEIFLWFFESGYYEDSDIMEVLKRIKELFNLFNEINIVEFVQWYAKYAMTFIKSALFRMQSKIIKESMKNKSRFSSKLKEYLHKNLKGEDLTLNFGNRP